MDVTGFSVLTAIIFIPIIAGVVILFLDRNNRDLVRGVAITAASAVLALSLAVFFGYDNYVKQAGGLIDQQMTLLAAGGDLSGAKMFAESLAFQQRIVWVESLGIAYHVGVDGVSAPMVSAHRHGRGGWRLDLLEYRRPLARIHGLLYVPGRRRLWRLHRRRSLYALLLLRTVDLSNVFANCGLGLGQAARITPR